MEWEALEVVQELHKLSDSHPENQRIIGRNRKVLEGVVHVLQNGGAKSKLWCCAVLVNLAYRSEENTAKIGWLLSFYSSDARQRNQHHSLHNLPCCEAVPRTFVPACL